MFLSKLKLILAPVMLACALAIGTASVRGRQDDGFDPGSAADRPRAERSDLASPAPEGGATEAPAFIKQSRGMIISRLEQELALAKNRLDRTLRRVAFPNDPAAVIGRKTVDEIEGLLDRIDGVLVDAVDRFPTMFDFSGGQGDLGSASASPSSANPKSANTVMVNSVDRFDFIPFPGGAADPARASASPSPGMPKTVGPNDVNQSSAAKAGDGQKNNRSDQPGNQNAKPLDGTNQNGTQGQHNNPSSRGKPAHSESNSQQAQNQPAQPLDRMNWKRQNQSAGQQQEPNQSQQQNSNQKQPQNPDQSLQQYLSQNPQQSPNQSQPQNPDAIGEKGLKASARKATDVVGIADVDLVVGESKRVLDIGGQTNFQIRLRNYGTKDATHLVVTAKLSPNLEFVKAGGRSQDVDAKYTPRENVVIFQRIDILGPSKEIILSIEAKVTGREPKLATCRVSVIHDDLPDGNVLEDMSGVKVKSPRRAW